MKIYTSLSGILRATPKDEETVYNEAMRMFLTTVGSYILSCIDDDPSAEEVPALKNLLDYMGHKYFDKYKVLAQDLKNRTYLIEGNTLYPLEKVQDKVVITLRFIKGNKTVNGESAGIMDGYDIVLDFPDASDIVKQSMLDSSKFDYLLGLSKGVIEHELSHVVQKHYEKYANKYPTLEDTGNTREFRNKLKHEANRLNKTGNNLTRWYLKWFQYVITPVELDPWILQSLNNFKMILKSHNISDFKTKLELRKKYLGVNKSQADLKSLIKTISDGIGSDLDSGFFHSLKLLRPKMYTYAVKKFEADYNRNPNLEQVDHAANSDINKLVPGLFGFSPTSVKNLSIDSALENKPEDSTTKQLNLLVD
jgi:hypothetical protein